MRKDTLTSVLTGVLTLSVLVSLVACYFYVMASRERRSLQGQVIGINNNRTIITALANDALEYSKRNSEIDQILESAGLKQGKTQPAAATKPASK